MHTLYLRRQLHLLPFVLTLIGTGSLPLQAQTPQWTQIWTDDFNGANGAAPDPTKWTYDLGNNFGNGEVDTATNSRLNSYLDGKGNLVIAALYNAPTNSYTTAHLKTAGLYAAGPYGRIEARIMTPFAPGVGSAFWALGNDYVTQNTPWPWSGELDIMEITSNTPGHNGSTIHGGETDSGTNFEYGGLSKTVDLPAGQQFNQAYHIFGVNWAPYHLTYDLDGQTYGEVYLHNLGITDIWPLNQPIYLILSVGVGAGNSGTANGSGFPTYLKADYVHVFQSASGVPSAPSNLTVTGTTSNATTLNWIASSTSDAKYNVYASTAANFTPSINTLVAENVAAETYTQTGLAASTRYYYQVVASDFGGESAPLKATVTTQAPGNSSALHLSAGGYAVGAYMNSEYVLGGNTNYHAGLLVDTSLVTGPAPQDVYQVERWGAAAWTITNLNPGQIYQVRLHMVETAHTGPGQRLFNVSVNSQTVLQNFDVYQTAGAMNRAITEQFSTKADRFGIIELQTNFGSSSNTSVDLNPTVSAIDITPGTGGALTGAAPGRQAGLSINSGGAAEGNFVADEDFNGGDVSTSTNTISTAGVTDAAPAAVYQSQRYVPFTYVLNGLVGGAAYTVRMHFAETYWTAAGKRIFNVGLNGTQVLSNFDVFAQAGANNALVKEFPTNADEYGQIIVQLLYGGADQPFISGLEAVQSAAAVGAPASLTATGSSSSVALAWMPSSTAGVTYTIYRSTAGVAPSSIGTGLNSTSYTDTKVSSGTTYSYYVVAISGSAQSASSNTASALVGSGGGGGSTISINAGDGATVNFVADADFSGGGAASTTSTITTAGVANAAPAAVYQSERAGVFTYTIPNLTAGSSYTVRLHFAEFYFTKAGQRVFNVGINGTTILTNFDIIAAAGAANKAVVQQFTASANGSGQIAVQFLAGTADQPKISGIEIIGGSSGTTGGTTAINSGGPANGGFLADADFAGGGTATTTNSIITAGVANAASAAVYQSERAGQFSYTIPNLTPGSSHTVRLHFAEFYFTNTGQRLFNVSLNGNSVLANFDIVAAAGGANKAVVEQFTATANASGQILIQFTPGSADQPKVSGVEVR